MKGKKININEIKNFTDRQSRDISEQKAKEFGPLIVELDRKSSKLAESISNYLIIRAVSYIESYWKHLTRELIDQYEFSSEEIFTNKEIIITLSDIDQIKNDEKITKGRLITL